MSFFVMGMPCGVVAATIPVISAERIRDVKKSPHKSRKESLVSAQVCNGQCR